MRRYITAFVIFTMLFFSTISIVKAECTEITGDTVETQQNFQFHGEPPGSPVKIGDKVTINGPDFKSEAKVIGITPDGKLRVGIWSESKNGNVSLNNSKFGKEAWEDTKESNTHTSKGRGDNVGDGFFSDVKSVEGNKFYSEAILFTGNTQASETYKKAAAEKARLGKNFDAKKFMDTQTNSKPGTEDYKKKLDYIKNSTPEQLKAQAQKESQTPQTSMHAKATMVKAIVCKETPGVDLCEDFANWPDPQPMTCHNGTFTPAPGACYKSTREDGPISSYTTRTPLLKDPLTRNPGFCDTDEKSYRTFETMSTFSKYSGKIKVNQKNMQDKLTSIVSQYNNELWTSKFQMEDRFWNPFQEGVISPGLPIYTKDETHYTVELDSWKDKTYVPNSILSESIKYVREKENINNGIVRKYNGSNINVFDKAPNPIVTHRYLDQKIWKDLRSTNIRCDQRYELLVEPRYKLTRHDRYQKVQQRDVKGRQQVMTYNCNEHDCSHWETEGTGKYDKNGNEITKSVYVKETCWDTCCYLAPDDHHQEWPDGETQHSSPAGEIEPIYAPRVKWRYRIGVGNEYHASAKRLTDKAKLTPVPNSKDTQKMKSGYGFKYSGDKWKIVTDYDEPQFKNESDVIRPNKNVALTLRGNIKSQTEYFDPNVQYDRAKNAPERSSSKDSRYIEERIKANKIKSDFNKNAISKFVSKTKDDSSLLRIRPYTKDSSVSGEKIIYRGKAINMETQFEAQSDPNKYYHAYWVTKGEPNLIPAYKQAPLHYVHLDYPSGTMYDIYSINRTYIRNGFTIDAYNTGSIKIVGNMWEDSFSRPDFRKSGN